MNILQSDIDEMKLVEEKVVKEKAEANKINIFGDWKPTRSQTFPCRCMIVLPDDKTSKERIQDILDKLDDEEQQDGNA